MEQKQETINIADLSHEYGQTNIRKQKIRYNLEYFLSYVDDYNITLLQKYSGSIDRKTTIISKCLTDKCENPSSKTFGQLLKSGSYCKVCTEKNKQEKMKATNMERYGFEHPSQVPGVKEKYKATSMERYGFDHPMKNSEFSEKVSHNAYKAYDYNYPSGKTIRLQGYERFAIDDLLSENINEDDIITKRTEVPECFYKDSEGNIHRYFVDILIQSQKLCIEVKSTWTLDKNREKVVLTKKALEDLGYKCEIWVYNEKGVRIEKI